MIARTAHEDTFARDHLPAVEHWPDLRFMLPHLQYAPLMNCATELLDAHIRAGKGERRCIVWPEGSWTYRDLFEAANRIANVLVNDLDVRPGNRVLLRDYNSPMLAAGWLAVMKAGAIAVTAMPLYRAGELAHMIEKAQITAAICNQELAAELETARVEAPALRSILYSGSSEIDGLERRMEKHAPSFDNVNTSADDVALIAFTSGTTGKAKATMHFHRDVIAVCDCFPHSVLRPEAGDLFTGSPPLSFTFGLGGLLLFPLRAGAATLMLRKAGPEFLAAAIEEYRVSVLFTAPMAYRALTPLAERCNFSSLRKCVSAGESLPLPVWQNWFERTGNKIIDGIGATEMLHIFISSPEESMRPGSTGQVVAGYEARVVDEEGGEAAAGEIGRLAVRGPTGCRYLDDPRQTDYVKDGWNFPGDAYRKDDDGFFWYVARADDMIIAAGYNISGPEVEEALLAHPDVGECAVVAKPDLERHTNIVKAFVVLADPNAARAGAAVESLQEFVKSKIAPYKVPREIEFVETLPRTETGKLQRFRLRQLSAG